MTAPLDLKMLREQNYETLGANPSIDDGVCVTCNCQVLYEGQKPEFDDEFCLRTKPYCTKSDDEHVDWRASCLHVQAVALELEERVASLEQTAKRRLEDLVYEANRAAEALKAKDEACELAETAECEYFATLNGPSRGELEIHHRRMTRLVALRAIGRSEGR